MYRDGGRWWSSSLHLRFRVLLFVVITERIVLKSQLFIIPIGELWSVAEESRGCYSEYKVERIFSNMLVHIPEHCLYTCKRVIVVNLRCRYEPPLVASIQGYIGRYVVHGQIESHDGNSKLTG